MNCAMLDFGNDLSFYLRYTISMDKSSYNKRRREICNKYEKTKNGFLMRLYRNMKSRISGVQKEKARLYAGKELLEKEDFYFWAKNSPEFHKMFKEYENSGYDRKLAPTVDRINSDIGYVVSNMEWKTHSENSARTSNNVAVVVNGIFFDTLKDAAKYFNVPYSSTLSYYLKQGIKRENRYGIDSIERG